MIVIGERWLGERDENGKRCIDDEDDHILMEISTLLSREGKVIVVTADGARVPGREPRRRAGQEADKTRLSGAPSRI